MDLPYRCQRGSYPVPECKRFLDWIRWQGLFRSTKGHHRSQPFLSSAFPLRNLCASCKSWKRGAASRFTEWSRKSGILTRWNSPCFWRILSRDCSGCISRKGPSARGRRCSEARTSRTRLCSAPRNRERGRERDSPAWRRGPLFRCTREPTCGFRCRSRSAFPGSHPECFLSWTNSTQLSHRSTRFSTPNQNSYVSIKSFVTSSIGWMYFFTVWICRTGFCTLVRNSRHGSPCLKR